LFLSFFKRVVLHTPSLGLVKIPVKSGRAQVSTTVGAFDYCGISRGDNVMHIGPVRCQGSRLISAILTTPGSAQVPPPLLPFLVDLQVCLVGLTGFQFLATDITLPPIPMLIFFVLGTLLRVVKSSTTLALVQTQPLPSFLLLQCKKIILKSETIA
jgi:hypothetical protein